MFSHYLVLYLFLAHLVATFLASFVLSLIIEVPFIRLEQAITKYFAKKREQVGKRHSSKYYYSVNPKHQSPTVIDNLRASKQKQAPLTEKYSLNSIDSQLYLMNNKRYESQYSRDSNSSNGSSGSSASDGSSTSHTSTTVRL